MTRNLAGFYRQYGTDKVGSLDEAVETAIDEAVEYGFERTTLEINKQQTGITSNDRYRVALLGRTRKSLARETSKARVKREGEPT